MSDAADQLDREYEERLEGWAERLGRQGYLRLGRGTVFEVDMTSASWHWRTSGAAGGDANTPRDAIAAALHALDVD